MLKSISPTIKTIIAVSLLVLGLKWGFIGILGIIVVWVWTKWPKWVKVLVTLPFGIIIFLTLFLSVGILAYLLWMRPSHLVGASMAPGYKDGAYILTKVFTTQNRVINRGDVVVFKLPNNPEKQSIKRVVGLPNESIMHQSGSIFINEQKLDESKYLSPTVPTDGGVFLEEGQTLTIPEGQYLVLGDNRSQSTDSREWGFVPQENIIGKVAFCYWNCK